MNRTLCRFKDPQTWQKKLIQNHLQIKEKSFYKIDRDNSFISKIYSMLKSSLLYINEHLLRTISPSIIFHLRAQLLRVFWQWIDQILPIVSSWMTRGNEEKLIIQKSFDIIFILFNTKSPDFNSFQWDFTVRN